MSEQMETQTTEDKFFGVKTTFDKKAKKAEEQSDIDL